MPLKRLISTIKGIPSCRCIIHAPVLTAEMVVVADAVMKEVVVMVVAVVQVVVIAEAQVIAAAGASCNCTRKWQAALGSLYLIISFAVAAHLSPKNT